MRRALLLAVVLSATVGAAVAGESDVPRRLGPTVAEAPAAPIARKPTATDGPRRRARQLGPFAKLRRARYTLSLLKELKAGRENATR